MQKLIAIWDIFITRILYYPRTILLLGAIGLAIIEVIRRYGFGASFYWQEDVVVYTILSAVFLQLCDTQWDKSHLQVTLFVDLLLNKGRVRNSLGRAMNLLAYAVSSVYIIMFVYWGVPRVLYFRETEQMIFSQIARFWPFFLILIIGFGLLAITFMLQCYQEFQTMKAEKQEDRI